MEYTIESKVLNLRYHKNKSGDVVFEDGVEYSSEEITQIKKIGLRTKETKLQEKIHMLKKAFDCKIDFVYVL